MAQLMFQPGDLIGGRYRLNRLIGAGAMGAVWSARNESTDRDFALKLMLPDSVQNPQALQRFFQEAKASGRLRHRCIVEVYDLGRVEPMAGGAADSRVGTPYIVMELLEGEPLDVVLRAHKKLPWGTALRIIADVARALEIAHKQSIIHRDLKPGNIFLHKSLDGPIVPKILDFGISKLIGQNHDPIATSIGTVLGSPAYMSPEQASGELDIDGRSDVWSLGVILYRCLCGALPFQAPNYNALMMAIATQEPVRISERAAGLPEDVTELVHTCLQKRRDDRFRTAKAFADAIDGVLSRTPLPTADLHELVQTPVELPSDDMKTVATDAGAGTLAATEIDDDNAETRAMQSGSLPLQVVQASTSTSASAAQITQPRASTSVPPPFRQKLGRNAYVIGGVAVAALVTAIVVVAALGGREDAPKAPATPTSEPAMSVPKHPREGDDPTATPGVATTAKTAATNAATAPGPSGSTSGAASVAAVQSTTPTKPTATNTAKPTGYGTKPKPTGDKPAPHEGVTGAGF